MLSDFFSVFEATVAKIGEPPPSAEEPAAKEGDPAADGETRLIALTVGQAERHKAVCDEIALELELWRRAKYTEFCQSRGSNAIKEPSANELVRRINTRHSSDRKWKPYDKNRVIRHLEAALGYKIDEAKFVTFHNGKNEPAAKSDRARKVRERFPDYGRADICLYWAGLSRKSVEFAKESFQEIEKFVKAIKTDLSYRRAVEFVVLKWPH